MRFCEICSFKKEWTTAAKKENNDTTKEEDIDKKDVASLLPLSRK
jgi:hypothetical protein